MSGHFPASRQPRHQTRQHHREPALLVPLGRGEQLDRQRRTGHRLRHRHRRRRHLRCLQRHWRRRSRLRPHHLLPRHPQRNQCLIHSTYTHTHTHTHTLTHTLTHSHTHTENEQIQQRSESLLSSSEQDKGSIPARCVAPIIRSPAPSPLPPPCIVTYFSFFVRIKT